MIQPGGFLQTETISAPVSFSSKDWRFWLAFAGFQASETSSVEGGAGGLGGGLPADWASLAPLES